MRSVYSPVRTLYSPIRAIRSSPVRVLDSPYRVISSPIRTLPSILNREYERIENRIRPRSSYLATEEYLNSASARQFDDEARDIRVHSSALLRKINSNTPRAESVSRVNLISRYEPVLESRANRDYYSAYYSPTNWVKKEVDPYVQYHDNAKKYMGPSHLASVRIVGNKPYYKRSPFCEDYDDLFCSKTHSKVHNDVKFLSYYSKNRNAANNKSDMESAKLDPCRPSRKFTQPLLLDDPKADMKDKQAARSERLTTGRVISVDVPKNSDLEKMKQKRIEEAKRMEERALLEEANRKAEAAKKDAEARAAESARQAQAKAEADRKMEEEARHADDLRKAEEARLAEEARVAEEAKQAAEKEQAAKLAAEAAKAKLAEDAKLAEAAKIAEAAKLAEEAKLAEAAKLAAEQARIAEEAKLAEEQRVREEEIARLAEIERLADEEKEADYARQAAELAEIARQEADIAEKTKKRNQDDGDGFGFEDVVEAEPYVEEPQSPEVNIMHEEDITDATPEVEANTEVEIVSLEAEEVLFDDADEE